MTTGTGSIPKPKLIACCDPGTAVVVSKIAQSWFDVIATQTIQRVRTMLETPNGSATSAIVIDGSTFHGNPIDLLRDIAKLAPQVRRILMTQQVDLSLIVNGLHSGVIHRIVYKPINPMELAAAICPRPLNAAAQSAATTASTSTAQSAVAG
jgi:DNA-binding NtrC family response regulator